MTNKNNTTLYIGVTSNLYARVYEHKQCFYPYSFTSRYKLRKLVWYDVFSSIEEAIQFEKYLKGKRRSFKELLINQNNKHWDDLWNEDI